VEIDGFIGLSNFRCEVFLAQSVKSEDLPVDLQVVYVYFSPARPKLCIP